MKIKLYFSGIIACLFFLPSFTFAATLSPGMQGNEIHQLQSFLSQYSDIYPHRKVTGYFGPLTEAAVKRFQKKYSIPTTGIVGSKTQAKIQEISNAKPLISATLSGLNTRTTSSLSLTTKCEKAGTLITSPLALEHLSYIVPMGQMFGDHVTPTDHQYWVSPNGYLADKHYEIFAPANGSIVSIQRMPQTGPMANDFRLVIDFSCQRSAIFIHLKDLVPKLVQALGSSDSITTNITVVAGEVIGHSNGIFDFSLVDKDVTLPGFVHPEYYQDEPWKIHTVDPFEYFTDSIRSHLIAKSLRQVSPVGGKIDYDIDGTLVGNWFLNGNQYRDASNYQDYFRNHLSIIYHHIDPSSIIISTGAYQGQSQQFAIVSNTPKPETITLTSGIIKYELVEPVLYRANTNQPWDQKTYASDIVVRASSNIKGTVLLQLIDQNHLLAEFFPNKLSQEISSFTSAVQHYHR